VVAAETHQVDVLAHDEALTSLFEFDPRKARVVELRYFGGLSVEETAEVLGISPETAKRDWKTAKAWLFGELTGETVRSGSRRVGPAACISGNVSHM
jgi:RNA polymerase sigma-70 factor (ECF subfamily)